MKGKQRLAVTALIVLLGLSILVPLNLTLDRVWRGLQISLEAPSHVPIALRLLTVLYALAVLYPWLALLFSARSQSAEQPARAPELQHDPVLSYTVPLLILTAVALSGWYAILFPDALQGAIQVYQDSSSPWQIILASARNLFAPLPMTFFLSWLSGMGILTLQAWHHNLRPHGMLHVAARLVVAFVVGLLGTGWFQSPLQDGTFSPWYLVTAVAVAAPLDLVRAGLEQARTRIDSLDDSWFKRLLRQFTLPAWSSKRPLSELDKLKGWQNARLQAEGVQSAQALATADLEQLAQDTAFDAKDLTAWADRALLYLHLKDKWWQRFAALEEKEDAQPFEATATSLLDACMDTTSGEVDQTKIAQFIQKHNLGSEEPAAGAAISGEPARPVLTIDALEIILVALRRDPNIAPVRALKG